MENVTIVILGHKVGGLVEAYTNCRTLNIVISETNPTSHHWKLIIFQPLLQQTNSTTRNSGSVRYLIGQRLLVVGRFWSEETMGWNKDFTSESRD